MGFKYGPIEIDTDFSSSETSLASSSSDEEKKMNKKSAKGKDKKYKPENVENYAEFIGAPSYRKKGEERKKTRFLPPPSETEVADVTTPKELPKDVGKLGEKEVRSALISFVNSQSCWKSTAAETMEMKELKLNSAFIYKVEVFTEVRKVKWKTEGYKKDEKPVDPVQAGESPMPWDMEVDLPKAFHEGKKKVEVPHTASVRKCWYCKGKAKTKCRQCKGGAYQTCAHCSGAGEMMFGEEMQPCGPCGGSGQTACPRCHGHGNYKCKNCGGNKKLKWFVQANCKWEVHKEEKVHEETALPDHLVKQVKSQDVFCDEQPMLKPLEEFPEEHIIIFSKQLLPEMIEKYKKEGRIVRVRHSVRVTPVTEVKWNFEGTGGTFFVYGLDRKVYFPDYPQQSCCSLL